LRQVKAIIDDQEGKIIIFCDFRGTLSVVENALESEKIEYLRIDRSLSGAKRTATQATFEDKTDKRRVLLMTRASGGVGVSLVAARHSVAIRQYY
jgi:SNF2 family DNA or RNA helicase